MSEESSYSFYVYKKRRFEEGKIYFHGRSRHDALSPAIAALIDGAEQSTGHNLSGLRWISNQHYDRKTFAPLDDHYCPVDVHTAADVEAIFDGNDTTLAKCESRTTIAPEQITAIRAQLELLFEWCITHPQEIAHAAYPQIDSFCSTFGKNAAEEWAKHYKYVLSDIEYAKQFNVFTDSQLLSVNDGDSPIEYLSLLKGLLDCFKYAEAQQDSTFAYYYETYGDWVTKSEVLASVA